MHLRQLRFFITVSEEGSFTKAAFRLNVAQSVLSTNVKALESAVGATLFLRSGTGAQLTQAGVIMIEHARAILQRLDLARRQVKDAPAEKQVVKLGIPSGSGRVLTLPVLKAIYDGLSGIDVHVTESLSGDLEESLRTGQIDLSLLFKPARGRSTAARSVERLYLVRAREGHAGSGPESGPMTVAQLADVGLTMPTERHQVRRFLNQVIARQNATIRIVRELDSTARIMELVLNERANSVMLPLAFFPEWQANKLDARPINMGTLERVILVTPQMSQDRRSAVEAVRRVVTTVSEGISASIATAMAPGVPRGRTSSTGSMK